jgi:hypothetical protein
VCVHATMNYETCKSAIALYLSVIKKECVTKVLICVRGGPNQPLHRDPKC